MTTARSTVTATVAARKCAQFLLSASFLCFVSSAFVVDIVITPANAADIPHVPSLHLPRRELLRTKIPARIVTLQAECTYRNASSANVTRFVHRVTMPPADLEYQILLDITGDGIENAQAKKHKNGIDRFLSFSFPIPAHSSVTHRVAYTLLLVPVDYLKVTPRWPNRLTLPESAKAYLNPSPYIESDSQTVRDVADKIARQSRNRLGHIRLAYEYPAQHLRFKPQPAAGALSALRTGVGDCTEFAAVFVALCRALGIPARQTGVFNFSKTHQTFTKPNHNAAEVYLGEAGWVPVDPNLGYGKYDKDYGLARTGNHVIVLLREGAWVWGNWLPPDGYDNAGGKPKISADMKWQVEVIKEGNAIGLRREYLRHSTREMQ